MTGPFEVGTIVLHRPIYAKRARRYTVSGYHADGRVQLTYSSPMARGGQYVTRTFYASPASVVRPVR